jgi:hypothetical protein
MHGSDDQHFSEGYEVTGKACPVIGSSTGGSKTEGMAARWRNLPTPVKSRGSQTLKPPKTLIYCARFVSGDPPNLICEKFVLESRPRVNTQYTKKI